MATILATCANIGYHTGAEVRNAARLGKLSTHTSGLAPSYIQANLIILPSRYANDFRLLCDRNTVPCALIAQSEVTGSYSHLKSFMPRVENKLVASSVDIRHDAPRYVVYQDGKLVKECTEIESEWTDDHIAFVIGCSFSFESALTAAGLIPRHVAMDRVVPMYKTSIPLCKAGVFDSGTYVVSMRSYKASEIGRVRDITRGYSLTHGEPIAWGWEAVSALGIKDIDVPDWGASPLTNDRRPFSTMKGDDADIPVFWGCGVTPQEAVMRAGLKGTIMAHSPGHMLVLDCRDWDILSSVE